MSGFAFLEELSGDQDTHELRLLGHPLPREFPAAPRQSLLVVLMQSCMMHGCSMRIGHA
jgi:hypothetical protein